jgi:hypothetical protein
MRKNMTQTNLFDGVITDVAQLPDKGKEFDDCVQALEATEREEQAASVTDENRVAYYEKLGRPAERRREQNAEQSRNRILNLIKRYNPHEYERLMRLKKGQ